MAGMPELIVNTTDYELRRAREELAAGWAGSMDTKRPDAWTQYGYPTEVSFSRLLTAYSRGGPGHGAVHRLLDKCWQEKPRIKEPNADKATPWETKLDALITSINGWQKLRDLDRRNMVGRYAALIYRVADGKRLEEALTPGFKLVDIVPVYENQIEVTLWHQDQNDPDNFGKPKMWTYRARRPDATNTQAKPDEQVNVHPSRVQVLAEGSVGDFFDGVPLLLAGFNSLIDLEKIGGGSAESYLKNSARTLVLKFDGNSSPADLASTPGEGAPTDLKAAIEAKTRALNRNIDSSLVLQGGEASTLQTTVSDPEPSFMVAANLFAASVQIPFTVLFGQQTGRMASDEDKADMVARCKSRQINELTPMLVEFVKRMQAAGLVEEREFEVEWPPLDAPGDAEKVDLVAKMAAAAKAAADTGVFELFDGNEYRRAAGYEERDAASFEDDPLPDDPPPGEPKVPGSVTAV